VEDLMTDFDTIDFFTDESLIADPNPYFEHLRAKCPITDLPHHGVMAVTGFNEANEVWRDAETFSSCCAVTGPFPGLPAVPDGADLNDFIEQNRVGLPMWEYLITQDPPLHTANRGLLMRLLTPKRMKENEDFIWRLADEQLDHAIGKRGFEVLGDLSQPFAMLVIADLLGVPEEDHRTFRGLLGNAPGALADVDKPPIADPLAFLSETFAAYVEDRRKQPREDVLTQMALATYPDGSVPEVADVVRTATFLFAAGQETTARVIGAALQIIGDSPEIQARLRAEPQTLLPNFVEEVLRLEGPVKTISRIARVDTNIGGVPVPAGTNVTVFPHAGSRDPRRFDNPDEFQLDRHNARQHLAFGKGIHTCPGGPLARTETRIALERLLARTSDIRISEANHGPADARQYEYLPTYIMRGLMELHVEVTPVD
jgi:cytochrome P450